MKRGWQAATVALIVVFGFFAFESFHLSLRDALGPGPGFFPFWLGMLGAVLAVFLLTQLHLDRVDLGTEALVFDRAGVRNAVLVLVGLIVATALLEVVGFRLSMLLLIPYLLLVLGVRNWVAVGICAVAGSFGVYYVFFDLLKVPLPVGIFGI
ncbi:MAG: tripartite tricarboxylate transporter TctB family protein [Betaproteobacteria bacterium]|nr:tripartite tricarboxylate transporter TctB family protein [Betaproteobacteria bacterium]